MAKINTHIPPPYYPAESDKTINRPAIQSRYRNAKITKLFPFDDPAAWTTISGGSKATDANYVMTSLLAPPVSIKVTASSTVTYIRQDVVEDVSNTQIVFRYYIHEGTPDGADDWQKIDGLYIYFYSSNGGANTLFYYPHIQNFALASPPHDYPGWHEYCWTFDGTNDDVDFALMDRIQVRFETSSGTPAISFDKLAFIDQPTVGYGMVTFDGWYDDDYQCATYLASKGIRGVFGGNSDLVGIAGHLTLAQLKDMQRAGHVIALYTDPTAKFKDEGLTADQALSQILDYQRWLYDNGFSEGAKHIFLSGGSQSWPADFDYDVMNRYFDTMRFTTMGNIYRTQGIYNLNRIYTNAFMTDGYDHSVALERLTIAGTEKGLFCVGIHAHEVEADTGEATWTNFKALIDAMVVEQDAGRIVIGTPGGYLMKYGV